MKENRTYKDEIIAMLSVCGEAVKNKTALTAEQEESLSAPQNLTVPLFTYDNGKMQVQMGY